MTLTLVRTPDDTLHRHCLRKPPHEAYYDCDLAPDDEDGADDVADTVIARLKPGDDQDCDVTWDATAQLVEYIMEAPTPEVRYRTMAWVIHRLVEHLCPQNGAACEPGVPAERAPASAPAGRGGLKGGGNA